MLTQKNGQVSHALEKKEIDKTLRHTQASNNDLSSINNDNTSH